MDAFVDFQFSNNSSFPFNILSSVVLQVVTVKEEWIAISILRLVETEKAVVEGAGATALAAILAGELQELKGKRSVTQSMRVACVCACVQTVT